MKCVKCGVELINDSFFTSQIINELFSGNKISQNNIDIFYTEGKVSYTCPFCHNKIFRTMEEFLIDISYEQRSQSESKTNTNVSDNNYQYNKSNYSNKEETSSKKLESNDLKETENGDINLPPYEELDYVINKINNIINSSGLSILSSIKSFSTEGLDLDGADANISSIPSKTNSLLDSNSAINETYKILKSVEDKLRTIDKNYDLYVASGYLNNLNANNGEIIIQGTTISSIDKTLIFERLGNTLKNNKDKYSFDQELLKESDYQAILNACVASSEIFQYNGIVELSQKEALTKKEQEIFDRWYNEIEKKCTSGESDSLLPGQLMIYAKITINKINSIADDEQKKDYIDKCSEALMAYYDKGMKNGNLTEEEKQSVFMLVASFSQQCQDGLQEDIKDLSTELEDVNSQIEAMETESKNRQLSKIASQPLLYSAGSVPPFLMGLTQNSQAEAFSKSELNNNKEYLALIDKQTDLVQKINTLNSKAATYQDIFDNNWKETDFFKQNHENIITHFKVENETTQITKVDSFTGAEYIDTEVTRKLVFYDKDNNKVEASDEMAALYFYQSGEKIPLFAENKAEIKDIMSCFKSEYITEDDLKLMNFYNNMFGVSYASNRVNNLIDKSMLLKGTAEAQRVIDKISTTVIDENGNEQIVTKNGFGVGCTLAWEGFLDGVCTFGRGFKNLFAVSGRTSASEYKNIVLSEYVTDNLSSGYQGVYEFSSMMGNMAPSIAISTIGSFFGVGWLGIAGQLSMGISAAGNAKVQGLQSGLNKHQAMLYGTLSGASEVTLEYLIGGIPGFKHLKLFEQKAGLVGYLTKALGEGTEEGLQDIIEPFFMALARGYGTDDFFVVLDENGNKVNDNKVFEQIDLKSAGHSALYGFLSALLLNAPSLAIDTYSNIKTGDAATIGNVYQTNLENNFKAVEGQKLSPLEIAKLRIDAINQTAKDAELISNNSSNVRDIKNRLSTSTELIDTFNKYNEGKSFNERKTYDQFLSDVAIQTSLTIAKDANSIDINSDVINDLNLQKQRLQNDYDAKVKALEEAKLKANDSNLTAEARASAELDIIQLESGIKKLSMDINNIDSKISTINEETIDVATIKLAEDIAKEMFEPGESKGSIIDRIKAFFNTKKDNDQISAEPTSSIYDLQQRLSLLNERLAKTNERIDKYGETSIELEYRENIQNEIDEINNKLNSIKDRLQSLGFDFDEIKELSAERIEVLKTIDELQARIDELEQQREALDKNDNEAMRIGMLIENIKNNQLNRYQQRLEYIDNTLNEVNNKVDVRDIINPTPNSDQSLIATFQEIFDKYKGHKDKEFIEDLSNPTEENYQKLQDKIATLKEGIANIEKELETSESIELKNRLQSELDELTKQSESMKQKLIEMGIIAEEIIETAPEISETEFKQQQLKEAEASLAEIQNKNKFERGKYYQTEQILLERIAKLKSELGIETSTKVITDTTKVEESTTENIEQIEEATPLENTQINPEEQIDDSDLSYFDEVNDNSEDGWDWDNWKVEVEVPTEINKETVSHYLQFADISDCIEFLKDKRVKEEIINNYSKNEFRELLESDRTGELLLSLFDEEGCKILNNCKDIEERLDYFLAFSKAKNELLNTDYFCKLMLDNSSKLTNPFNKISLSEHKYFLDYLVNNATTDSDLSSILYYLKKEENLYIAKHEKLSEELARKNLLSFDKEGVEWLLNNKDISIEDISISGFKNLLLKNVTIPDRLVTNKLINKLLDESSNLLESRLLINTYAINHDVTRINDVLRSKELQIIDSVNQENGLLPKYDSLLKDIIDLPTDDIYEFRRVLFGKGISSELRYELNEAFPNSDKISEIIHKQNNIELSDALIDYHFNDISYNVFLNIKELLSFQISNGQTVSAENLQLYKNILNIDNLSINEKMKLHQQLSSKNILEIFYDDMANARNVMNKSISDSILTKEKIQEFKNQQLSEQYGVSVYSFDGQEFYGLVKSGKLHRGRENIGGRSYSLIGKDAIGTFVDPKQGSTFLYEGLTPDQILHVFPFDSFTAYGEYNGNNQIATDRVRFLMTPKELLEATGKGYNELLILERGTNQSDMDSRIGDIKPLALYCYDQITPRDIAIAKAEGVGIMLIDTNAYDNQNVQNIRNSNVWDYNYITNDLSLRQDIDKIKASRDSITSFDQMEALDKIIKNSENDTTLVTNTTSAIDVVTNNAENEADLIYVRKGESIGVGEHPLIDYDAVIRILNDATLSEKALTSDIIASVPTSELLKAIAYAQNNGMEISLPENIQRIIDTMNSLQEGEVLLNQYEVSQGKEPLIASKAVVSKYGKEFIGQAIRSINLKTVDSLNTAKVNEFLIEVGYKTNEQVSVNEIVDQDIIEQKQDDVTRIDYITEDNKIDVARTQQINISDETLTLIADKLSKGQFTGLEDLYYESQKYEMDYGKLKDDIKRAFLKSIKNNGLSEGYFTIDEIESLRRLSEEQINNLIEGKAIDSISSSLQEKLNERFASLSDEKFEINGTDYGPIRTGYSMRAYINPLNAEIHRETILRYIQRCLEYGVDCTMKPTSTYSVPTIKTDKIPIYFNSVQNIKILEEVTSEIISEYGNAYGTPPLFGMMANNNAFTFGLQSMGLDTGRSLMDKYYGLAYARTLVSQSDIIKSEIAKIIAKEEGISQKEAVEAINDFINYNYSNIKIGKNNNVKMMLMNMYQASNGVIVNPNLIQMTLNKIINEGKIIIPTIDINTFRKDIMTFASLTKYGDTNHLMNPAISRYMIDNGLVDASTLKVYSYDTDSRIISNDLIQSEQIIEQGNSSHFETETNNNELTWEDEIVYDDEQMASNRQDMNALLYNLETLEISEVVDILDLHSIDENTLLEIYKYYQKNGYESTLNRLILEKIKSNAELQTENVYIKLINSMSDIEKVDFVNNLPNEMNRVNLMKQLSNEQKRYVALELTENDAILESIKYLNDEDFIAHLRTHLKLDAKTLEEISDRNTINIQNDIIELKKHLTERGITDSLSLARAIYLYLGKNTSYAEVGRRTTTSDYAAKINQETLVKADKNVVCYTWSALYKQALIEAGFNEKDVRIFSTDYSNSHNLVVFKIDSEYYVADATFGYVQRSVTDLLAIKLGSKTNGFYQLNYNIGKKIFENDTNILTERFKDMRFVHSDDGRYNDIIDSKLGYTLENEFYENASELERMLIDKINDEDEINISDDEVLEILIDTINTSNMNAHEILEVYYLLVPKNIKLATFSSNYKIDVRYSLLSVLQPDGKIKYYLKEDYMDFKEIQNLDETLEILNIDKQSRVGEIF